MGDSGSRVQVFCSAGNVQAASVSSAWTIILSIHSGHNQYCFINESLKCHAFISS